MLRFGKVVAAVALLVAGSVAVASPAAAAAPPVTIMHAYSYACLYQSFTASGAATVNAYFAESPCAVSGGNAQWRFEYLGGNNIYRIVNHRWDSRGLWCLSAPNNQWNETVYVELCDPANPAKQQWQPYANTITGMNRLRNVGAGTCLYRTDVTGYRHLPTMITCSPAGQTNESEDYKWI